MKYWKKMGAILCAVAMMASVLSASAWAAPTNISLQVNGQNVVLTDAAPQAKNGRTFIPVRAAFEALGADVTWDQATKSVHAVKGEDTVVMTLGSTTAQVTRTGQTQVLQMDVAPFAQGGRTYVPVRFAAQAFSCAVGWDSASRTVMIVDTGKLLEGYTFQNLDRWMQASLQQDVPNPANTTGYMYFAMQMPDDAGEVVTYPVSAAFAAVSTDTKAQLQLEADFSALATLLAGMDLTAQEKADLAAVCHANVETRVNLNTGKMYLNLVCPLLEETEESYDSNLWYLLDLAKLGKLAGESFDFTSYFNSIQAMQKNFTSSRDLLVSVLGNMELSGTMNYEALSTSASMICALLSDQAMTQSGNDYVVHYTLGAVGTSVDATMTYETSGDLLVGATMELTVADDADRMAFLFEVHDDGKNTSLHLYLETGDTNDVDWMKVDFSMGAVTEKSSGQPVVDPPAGAQIVDMADMMAAPLVEGAAA